MKKHLIRGSITVMALLSLSMILYLTLSTPAYADDESGGSSGQPFYPAIDDVDGEEEELDESHKAENAINNILASGVALVTQDHIAYMTGSENLFSPADHLTRAQSAQIIFRLLSKTVPITKTFSDVPADAWYAEAANTLGSLGVFQTGQDLFQPDAQVTRGEFVRYIAQFFPLRRDAKQFTDVAPDSPDAPYILSARAWGWLGGFDDGTVRPGLPISRAEAVSLLNRALGRSPDKAYIDRTHPVFFWDVAPSNWYYYDVAEASVTHDRTGHVLAEQWTSHTAVSPGIATGFLYRDGWLYYFDAGKNDVVRSGSVGNFDFNAQGRFTSGSDELDQLLHDIYVKETNESMTQEEKLRALYVYTRDSFSYRRRPPYEFGVLDFMQTDALNMLTTGYGNCYCYASVFWYLSRWAGYDSRIINGTVGQRRSPHSWVEITFDGTSYIFDTELEMAYRQKGQYINMYKWTGSGWNYIK